MTQPAILIENLGKRYTIGRQKQGVDGMRHGLEKVIRSPRAWLKAHRESRLKEVDFWALRNVSVRIDRGEVVGIIGRNGAGKSTLLKILSRITVPTEGRFRIDGRTASLLEVGTGFHQELTGRENVFLNGAILGMTRAEIMRKFDEIVEFSEIEDFLDTPVKRYSSGMYVRLAFAVAAHLEPEVLIVDEVLAVGDAAFQKKCLGKMGDFAQSGRTVLFVSHNMEAVRNLCQRGIWIKDGALHQDGFIEDVADAYFHSTSNEPAFSCANTDYGLKILKVTLKDGSGDEARQFEPGQNITIEISYEADNRIPNPLFALGIVGASGTCFTANMLLDGHRPDCLSGPGKISCRFHSVPLLPQKYTVKMRIQGADPGEMIVPYQEVAAFDVTGDLTPFGFKGEFVKYARHSTPVVVPYDWLLPDGTIASVALSRETAQSYEPQLG
jgi:lipopolysaccharide transport system ATP-binding protein